MDDTFKALVIFITDEWGDYDVAITPETLLEDDLGITGDDGAILINKFGKKFSVDVSNFKPADYFYPEPGTLFISKKKMIKPLTVGNLYNAIVSGSLTI